MCMCEVSVTIACYNVEKYIKECLLSVLNQDFDSMEVLVCDDCSTDNSLAIVGRIVKEHPRGNIVRIIRGEKNMGTAAIRNAGIDNAKGKYLLFLDGDDYLSENAVPILYRRMKDTDSEMVMGNHTLFIDEDNLNNVSSYNHSTEYPSEVINCHFAIAEWMKRRNTQYYPVALWNKLFNRSFLLNNNIRCKLSHSIIDDIYFAHQTMIKARKIAIVEDVTMFWRHRNGSAMHIDVREDRMRIYLDVFDTILDEIKTLKAKGENVPIQLYYTLTNRYVSGFVAKNILRSRLLTRKQKVGYLNHVKIITEQGVSYHDIGGLYSKICFIALGTSPRYYLLKFLFGLHDLKRRYQ